MEVPREELYLKWLGFRNNQKKKGGVAQNVAFLSQYESG